jgi:hypothetical protein
VNRVACRERGVVPMILIAQIRKLVEMAIGQLKHLRRVAMRRQKMKVSFDHGFPLNHPGPVVLTDRRVRLGGLQRTRGPHRTLRMSTRPRRGDQDSGHLQILDLADSLKSLNQPRKLDGGPWAAEEIALDLRASVVTKSV